MSHVMEVTLWVTWKVMWSKSHDESSDGSHIMSHVDILFKTPEGGLRAILHADYGMSFRAITMSFYQCTLISKFWSRICKTFPTQENVPELSTAISTSKIIFTTVGHSFIKWWKSHYESRGKSHDKSLDRSHIVSHVTVMEVKVWVTWRKSHHE